MSLIRKAALPLLLACLCAAALAQTPAETPTLLLPQVVKAYETFDVRVSGPGGSGDMLRFSDAQGTVLGGSYAYVGNAKNGVIRLTAPVEPGEYAVVYLAQREVVASYPLTVTPISARLEVAPEVEMNAAVEVAFEGPLNKGDYIQFTDAAGKPLSGLYAYVGIAKGDVLTLRAPTSPGDYRVAYFSGKREIGAVDIRVGGVQAQLRAPAEVAAGAHFSVDWSGPDNRGDMLRVMNAAGAAAGSYSYTGHNPGAVTLRAPEEPGDYSVVYLTGGQVIGETAFSVVAVSAALQAADAVPGAAYFPVTWEGPGNRGDRVQVVPPGSDDDVAYSYIDPARGEVVRVFAPAAPGQYELRYLSHGGRVLATRPLQVTPPPQPPGSLLVEAAGSSAFAADDAVELVLDASGSMLQRLDGERRVAIARRTLQALVADTIPAGTPFALRIFGHREAGACHTELEIPLAPLEPAAAQRSIGAVDAMNLAKTPIAESLRATAGDLQGVRGQRVIILVTDGEETCDGDPAAEIAALQAAGLDLRLNIVGFAIDDAALAATFARWAELGGGEYFRADNAAALAAALASAVNPEYRLFDAQGAAIARGIAGGEVLTLQPGNYVVESAGQRQPVQVVSGERVRVTLTR
ncbi:MAG: hypothetical protein CME59_03405 [Halioglobus sp.]|nr:hypothetical protein [Halioglobus sp.]